MFCTFSGVEPFPSVVQLEEPPVQRNYLLLQMCHHKKHHLIISKTLQTIDFNQRTAPNLYIRTRKSQELESANQATPTQASN